MTQANDTMKSGNVYKGFVGIMLVLVAVFGIISITSDNMVPVVNVDLSTIEARLALIETNQANTENVDLSIDTTALDLAVTKMEGFQNILDDLMNAAYGEDKEELEEDGLDTFDNVFEDDFDDFFEDFEDFFDKNIEGFDSLVSYDYDEAFFLNDIEDDFGTDGVKYTIINLGIDDSDDRQILVEREYKIKYELDDSDTVYKAYVLVSGMVTYDDDDGLEADMTFTLV